MCIKFTNYRKITHGTMNTVLMLFLYSVFFYFFLYLFAKCVQILTCNFMKCQLNFVGSFNFKEHLQNTVSSIKWTLSIEYAMKIKQIKECVRYNKNQAYHQIRFAMYFLNWMWNYDDHFPQSDKQMKFTLRYSCIYYTNTTMNFTPPPVRCSWKVQGLLDKTIFKNAV